MQNWTYVGTAAFGSGRVSLSDYTYNEVLVIAKVSDFAVYSSDTNLLLNSTTMEFYWVPEIGATTLANTFEHQTNSSYVTKDHLLIGIQFSPSYVETAYVRVVNRTTGSTTDYKSASHGHIDVYCR